MVKMKTQIQKRLTISDGISFAAAFGIHILGCIQLLIGPISSTYFQEKLIEPKANSAHKENAASLQFGGPLSESQNFLRVCVDVGQYLWAPQLTSQWPSRKIPTESTGAPPSFLGILLAPRRPFPASFLQLTVDQSGLGQPSRPLYQLGGCAISYPTRSESLPWGGLPPTSMFFFLRQSPSAFRCSLAFSFSWQ